ncbi:hypothetical protein [Streptomyces sp. NPDC060022]|uniref:hypothetical protein n=1 Tax=Streptomyces sp. NPDC060022 TaxID=3347039 RepID=UPI00369370AF
MQAGAEQHPWAESDLADPADPADPADRTVQTGRTGYDGGRSSVVEPAVRDEATVLVTALDERL